MRCSARQEARGKPAPDVYLTAARRLGVTAGTCLALEDSPNGIASARAAGMRCVAVPDPLLADDPRYREADLVLRSLTGLDEAVRLLPEPDLAGVAEEPAVADDAVAARRLTGEQRSLRGAGNGGQHLAQPPSPARFRQGAQPWCVGQQP